MKVHKSVGAVYKNDLLDSVLFVFFSSFQMQKEQQYSECEKGRLQKNPFLRPKSKLYTKITFVH